MRTWKIILLVILVYIVKECEPYRDIEGYFGPEGECQFREVEKWREKIDDVQVSKGSVFERATIGNANLENLSCGYIPRIFLHFKSLYQLLVKNCGSMKLQAETFQEATIRKFIANENNYPKIEDFTFSEAENLEDLDLKRNKIREVSQHAFTDCRKLKTVDLSENDIRELQAGSFNCPMLEILNLTHNKIEQIKAETFSRARYLVALNLTHNKITEISDDGFKGLTKLQHLRLGHNKLTQLKKEMLEKMGKLNSLDLANNKIEVLDADTFRGNLKLNEIYLQNNQLEAVAAGTFRDSNLKQLDLDGNSCGEIINGRWNIDTCIVEYNRRKSSTNSSTTTIESTSERSPQLILTKIYQLISTGACHSTYFY
jgi:Leucine-rich repeat (LRR) protein